MVVVLFQKKFDEIPCVAKILDWLSHNTHPSTALHLVHCLVYDNSPTPSQQAVAGHARISGLQNPQNGGTRAAYLAAVDVALALNCQWILLLDHDTDLPSNFFTAADSALAKLVSGFAVAAVIPQVFDKTVQVSPSWITSYGRVSSHPETGELKGGRNSSLTAIASAAIIKTCYLSAILPIPEEFRLDYLDHWLFREMQLRGGALVISSAKIKHSLSVFSMKSMNPQRYRAILLAERQFLRCNGSYSRVKHGFWQLMRIVKVFLLTRRFDLCRISFRAFQNIIISREK